MSANGFNQMRWDCKEKGCFNWQKRPKIEVFAECFPGLINFGDIDGIVEIAGNALLLEWKPAKQEVSTGQRIMYERLTEDGRICVIILAGDARNMSVTHLRYVFLGEFFEWEECSLDAARTSMSDWAEWAKKNSRINRPVLRLSA
jgi:hypothetical protein